MAQDRALHIRYVQSTMCRTKCHWNCVLFFKLIELTRAGFFAYCISDLVSIHVMNSVHCVVVKMLALEMETLLKHKFFSQVGISKAPVDPRIVVDVLHVCVEGPCVERGCWARLTCCGVQAVPQRKGHLLSLSWCAEHVQVRKRLILHHLCTKNKFHAVREII